MQEDIIGKWDITIIQNQPFSTAFEFVDEEENPIDLTVYPRISWAVFLRGKKIFQKELGDGVSVSGENNSYLVLFADNNTTRQMVPSTDYDYELVTFNAQGVPGYKIQSKAVVKKTDTR